VPKHGSINSIAASLRSFTNFEHLGAANRASALGCRATVLHSDLLWVLHFTFGLALHAIGFHIGPPSFRILLCTASHCAHRATPRRIIDRRSTLLQLFELVASSVG
jgi:hypothetical protein